jgi:hypothetical membrane protein
MKQRFLSMCGLIAPVLFVLMTILGGALRPGYSQLSDTISELMSPGSPNKLLLDTLHTLYALLLTMFGIGLLRLVRRGKRVRAIGTIGASFFIVMGLVSVSTATAFPQGPWGSPATFAGEMHMILHGVISLLTILSMLCLGIWFHRAEILPGFRTYSFATAGVAIVSAGFFLVSLGGPIMGLAERIAALVGFQWIFRLALWMYSPKGDATGQVRETVRR